MCGRVTMLAFDEVLGVLECLRFHAPLNVMPDWPAREQARAQAGVGAQVNVLVGPEAQRLEIQELCWGFKPSWSKKPLFNTRVETLFAGSSTWADALRSGRCLFPVAGFFEPHRTETAVSPRTGKPVKRQYTFAATDGTPLLLAGLTNGAELSVVTTEPNASVAPVHHRMPLVLNAEEAHVWLESGAQGLEDRSVFELNAQAVEPTSRNSDSEPQLSLF